MGIGIDSFEGKVAVVTGAAGGIGAGLARMLTAEGAAVALADIDEDGMRDVADGLDSPTHTHALCVPTDVTSPESVDSLAETVEERLGPVDLVFNNAGVAVYGPAAQMTLADWHFVMDINFWGVVHGIRTFVPRLIQRGSGHVVNTASMAGLVGMTGLSVYNASKFAVVGVSESLYRELGPLGIGVTVICPMIVDTRINANSARLWARARGEDEPEEIGDEPAALVGGIVAVDDVTRSVREAMRTGELYALTHPEQRDILARRHARIDTAALRVTNAG